MAKIKNTGHQPRGFIGADGSQVTIPPGGEAEVNMTEADHKYLSKLMEDHDDPKPFEISGGHAAEAKSKKEKKEEGDDDAHNPAQSTEPPATAPATAPPTITPMTDREKREREQKSAGRVESGRAEEERTTHRGR